tara:strand:- start:441 stop:923 length:483 start_codon:yes stop_codon:yes gene_type:complete
MKAFIKMKKICIPPFFCIALLLVSKTTVAVMPPDIYINARKSAGHHVQINISSVKIPQKTPGTCRLSGVVEKVFRSKNGSLAPGIEVAFDVSCLRRFDQPGVGGTLWGSVDAIKSAKFIEVYLNGDDLPNLGVARWQYILIPAPTADPKCPMNKPGMTCW